MASARSAVKLSIRRFRDEDLGAVLRIEKQAFDLDAWPREAFDGYGTNPAAIFLVALRGGRLCGYSLSWMTREAAELYSLGVLQRERGRGVARALLRKTIRELKRARIGNLRLTVRPGNLAAIALYESFGFKRKRVIKQYYEDGSDGVRMRLRLEILG